MSELKRCPFCSGSVIEIVTDDGIDWERCKACGATGPANGKQDDEPKFTWNTRAPDRELIRYALQQVGWPVKLPSIEDFTAYWSERGWNVARVSNPSGYVEFIDRNTHNIWMGWRAATEMIPQPPFTDLDAAVETIASGWEASE